MNKNSTANSLFSIISTSMTTALFVTCFSNPSLGATDAPDGPLFDPSVWAQEVKQLKSTESLALERWIAIHYDHYLERPWEAADFRTEYLKRLENFKKSFCPQVTAICQVVIDQKSKAEKFVPSVSALITRPETVDQINATLATKSSKVRLSLPIRTPGLIPEDDQLNGFNFLIGEFVDTGSFTLVKHLVLSDIYSYYQGYQQKDSPNYVAIESGKKVYVLNETLMSGAIDLAKDIESSQTAPDNLSAFDVPKFLLKKYLAEKQSELDKIINGNKKNGEKLSRLEAIEWIAYRGLEKLVTIQSSLLKTAPAPYTIASFLEVFMKTQQLAEPTLYSYLLTNYSLYENSPVLNQLATKKLVNILIRENLTLMLAHHPYTQNGKFEEWSKNFNLAQLINKAQFKEFLPKLDAYLESKDLYNLNNWAALSAAQRRFIFECMLFPKTLDDGKTNTTELSNIGFYGLWNELIRTNPPTLLNEMASIVVATRLPKSNKVIKWTRTTFGPEKKD